MTPEQKRELGTLTERLKLYQKVRGEIKEIENQIDLIYRQCKHEEKYITGYDNDPLDGTFARVVCPDCGYSYENKASRCRDVQTIEEYNRKKLKQQKYGEEVIGKLQNALKKGELTYDLLKNAVDEIERL